MKNTTVPPEKCTFNPTVAFEKQNGMLERGDVLQTFLFNWLRMFYILVGLKHKESIQRLRREVLLDHISEVAKTEGSISPRMGFVS